MAGVSARHSAEKVRAARLSVAWNILLVTLKVVAGVISGSMSVLSEAAHSGADLIAAGLAFFSVRVAARPADERHPFGHGKWENLSGTIEAAMILLASLFIIWEAARRLVMGARVEQLTGAMAVMLLAGVVNYFLSGYLFRVAARNDSVALDADGHNLRMDVYTSTGVLIGLVLIRVTGYAPLDSWIAIGVGLYNLRVAWDVIRGAAGPLLDVSLPEEEVELMGRLLRQDPRVLGFHKLRTRRSGPYRHVDVHLFVRDDMGVGEAHDVAEKAENRIREALANVQIVTHVEPWSEQSPQDRARFLHWREQQ